LIDARYGVQTQTRRHSYIASLLGIKHTIVAINKMDLMDFDQQKFKSIKADYLEFAKVLNKQDIQFVPISALDGDNVVDRSDRSDWYTGQTLMEMLNSVEIAADKNITDFRFPVQYVNRPNLDFRGFCGTVASGVVNKGDAITALPSGKSSKVKDIVTYDGSLDQAFVGQAVTITLEDEIDISRGDVIVKSDDDLQTSNCLKTHLVWMSEANLVLGKEYLFKFASKVVTGIVENIDYNIDVNTQEHVKVDSLQLNDISVVDVKLSQPVLADVYDDNRATGAFIVIDRLSNITVGAGMVNAVLEQKGDAPAETNFSAFEVELNVLIRKHFPHWDAKDLSQLLK
jgi:sulfate adenylyltransferase subunit 1